MHKPLSLRLAWQSLKKGMQVYGPFLAGSILICAMITSLLVLMNNPGLDEIYGYVAIKETLFFGMIVVIVFCAILFLYFSRVLQKNRAPEQGLYLVLGLGHGNLIQVLFWQYLILLAGTLITGIPLGLLFEKVMFLVLLKILNVPAAFGFSVNMESLMMVCGIMALYFACLFVLACFSSLKSSPVSLLRSHNQGEKKVKVHWLAGLLGLVCLCIGYGMALSIDDPIKAISFFFVAVLFVIAGTYLLFLYGSVILVRMLEKNKSYYYQTNHFVSVSLMKYRLRQNSASLASIAILSTMVLVALSTTITLVSSISSLADFSYLRQVKVTATVYNYSKDGTDFMMNKMENAALQSDLQPENMYAYRIISPLGEIDGKKLVVQTIPQSDASQWIPQAENLASGQVLLVSDDPEEITSMQIDGQEYSISDTVDSTSLPPIVQPYLNTNMNDVKTVIMNDEDFARWSSKDPTDNPYYILVNFDTPMMDESSGTAVNESAQAIANEFFDHITFNNDVVASMFAATRADEVYTAMTLYGGMLFVGIYVSILFLLAVALIMYYKQISEGMDDKERFKILQNAGLEKKQIRSIINSQVLILFFLPLATACVHIAFAFKMIESIIYVIGRISPWLFAGVTLGCIGVFALIYALIYKLTSRTYYRLTAQA